ncbi:MAG: hypothetical protein ACRENW_05890 [Thermodesulfobacteriota bacterium]
MSRFRIVIQRIEDNDETERVTELDRIDVPALDARFLEKETALDHLEARTLATGHDVMRHLLVRQWEGVDQQLVANYQELFSPRPDEARRDGSPQGGQPGGGAAPAPPGAPTRRRRTRGAGQ